MKLRSGAVAVVSLAIGLALVGLLLRISGLGLQDITARFAGMDTRAFFGLVCLIILNAFLSSEKWRITDRAIRHTSNRELSQFESFTLSALGSALGQILPVQLSMPLARTLGTRIHGRAFNRGTLGSLFEQSFDVFFGCFLMIASVGTYLLHGQWNIWVALAVPCAAIAILSVGTILGLTRRLAGKAVSERANPVGWRKFAIELSNSALLEPALGRKLMFFSALRFVVFVLMAGEITRAIHMAIPLWRLAAAMPFALLSTAAGITPGGLGLAEFTYVGVLAALGTPV